MASRAGANGLLLGVPGTPWIRNVDLSPGAVLSADVWTHIAVVMDGPIVSMYAGGSFVTDVSVSVAEELWAWSSPLVIGHEYD